MTDPVLNVYTVTTVSRSFECEVDYLVKNWDLLQMRMNIPKNAQIDVCIPGGSDWSNMDVDAKDITARVSWTTTTEESSGDA